MTKKRGSRGLGSSGKDRTAHEAKRGVKQRAMKISDLSYEPLTDDEYSEAVEAIESEDDRSAGILGCTLIEDALKSILISVIENSDDLDSVFRAKEGPFNTLSQKTTAAYALGFFNKQVKSDIDTIRSIRNQFSHALRKIDFNSPEISIECKKLSFCLEEPDLNQSARKKYEAVCLDITVLIKRRTDKILRIRLERLEEAMQEFNEQNSPNNLLPD